MKAGCFQEIKNPLQDIEPMGQTKQRWFFLALLTAQLSDFSIFPIWVHIAVCFLSGAPDQTGLVLGAMAHGTVPVFRPHPRQAWYL